VTEGSKVPADSGLLDGLTAIASRAAAAIVAIALPALAQRSKPDHSPVTAADLASQDVIFEGLGRLLPGVAVVSEEAVTAVAPGSLGRQFILVDPLDGTRELLAGRDEFTVNIALVNDGRPVAGVVAAPARGIVWRGMVGTGAERFILAPGSELRAARERTPLHTRARPEHALVALVSRSHLDPATEAYIARLKPAQRISCGSSLKFCQLAEGIADIYPRLTATSEWDIAAGHAVLACAGGAVTTPEGGAISYGRPGFRIPAFIAWGDYAASIAR
jgi:3'(2'), 5'-bisphosphate nucleotidase